MILPEDFQEKALALLQSNAGRKYTLETIIYKLTHKPARTPEETGLARIYLGNLEKQGLAKSYRSRNNAYVFTLAIHPPEPPPPPPTPLGAPTRYPSWLSVSNGWIYTICDDGTIWRASEAEPDAWHALPGVPQP